MKKNTALHSMLLVICTFSQNWELCVNTSTPQRVQKVCVWYRGLLSSWFVFVRAAGRQLSIVLWLWQNCFQKWLQQTSLRQDIGWISVLLITITLLDCVTPLSERISGIYYILNVWECIFFFFSLKTEVTVYLQFKLTEFFYPASRNDMDTYK